MGDALELADMRAKQQVADANSRRVTEERRREENEDRRAAREEIWRAAEEERRRAGEDQRLAASMVILTPRGVLNVVSKFSITIFPKVYLTV